MYIIIPQIHVFVYGVFPTFPLIFRKTWKKWEGLPKRQASTGGPPSMRPVSSPQLEAIAGCSMNKFLQSSINICIYTYMYIYII